MSTLGENIDVEESRFANQMLAQQGKPTKITLLDGEILLCTPQQALEEEYESYLIEMIKTSPNYGSVGVLSEVCGKDIKSIDPI